MLAVGLAPEVVVIVGEVVQAWDKIRPVIGEALGHGSFGNALVRIVATDPVTQPWLRGAVALVLQKHFNPQLIG